jgi:hypothetical protein
LAQGHLAYFQAFTNTYAHPRRLKALYDEALSEPGVMGLCVGTRPDCVNREILDLLASYLDRFMVWVEFGLQSAHEETLKKIRRGHGFQRFVAASEEASRRGLMVCAHVILGLPGEGSAEIRETACRISALPLHGLKIHALYIVRGTAMEKLYRDGDYVPWSRAQYANAVCDVLERVPPRWVIQRLTGDPSADSLVAPQWTREKQETLKSIWVRLEGRDTWQGKTLGASLEDLGH